MIRGMYSAKKSQRLEEYSFVITQFDIQWTIGFQSEVCRKKTSRFELKYGSCGSLEIYHHPYHTCTSSYVVMLL